MIVGFVLGYLKAVRDVQKLIRSMPTSRPKTRCYTQGVLRYDDPRPVHRS